MAVRNTLYFLIFSVLLFACNKEAAQPETGKKEAWVTDEVLVQLQEIKSELAEMKKQQEEIKALLEMGAVRAGAPAAKSVASVSLKGTPAPSAKVAVVEFTDYQCPFCARHAKNVLPQIRENFVSKGTVFYEVRNFPLDFHAEAKGAATAVGCMPKGKSTALHDWIFNHPSSLNRAAYIAEAKAQGVKEKTFTACLDDPARAKDIDADIAYGMGFSLAQSVATRSLMSL